ncbi:interleukin-2 receptor subunit beta isoform X2 [Cebus imitator]|uniref:Interleukin-2 receptor subunit beta n=2 Tax=Cebus imitator TaxID=2715852 RepID=A0A2K5S7Q5_CEBIM|nr:interleukin-2 receptor subunit beta isoform X2 [Cebus imitator]
MAAPALSWHLPLLALLLSLATPWASAAVNGTSQLTCFYNSRANISCVWSQAEALQDTSCQVQARPDKRPWNQTCELLPVSQASRACNLILGPPDSQKLTSADIVNLRVMCREGARWRMMTTQDFEPFENFRLMAPISLQVVYMGTHDCNISWEISQASHYFERKLESEARMLSPGCTWEEAPLLTLKQQQEWMFLDTLTPDTHYELQVRIRPLRGKHTTWSPWSQPLTFRTRPAAPGKDTPPWPSHLLVGFSGACGFIILVYLLVNCRNTGPWLKKVLKCHTPDPSKFFSQLSSEHGGDIQKWLSSPFPSSSFSPGGLTPEISPLEVLESDKATQLLLQQAKVPEPTSLSSKRSLTSCFTNQGYFFFRLPDALEIEACQVYFTYDPCAEEEPDEGGAGAPTGSSPHPLWPLSGEDDAYCTFPPGDDLLLFSPSLLSGPSPPNTALGSSGASEERLPLSLQERVPRDWDLQPPRPPTPGVPDLVDFQPPPELVLREAGEEVPDPGHREGAGFPWASPPGQGQVRVLNCRLPLNTDAYLSLQEIQDQDPGHLV